MALDDLVEQLRTQPFQPFRIRLRDGQHHDVCHRHISLVLRTSVLIDREEAHGVERLVTISADEVESIEPVR
jgi:hypothetical protein